MIAICGDSFAVPDPEYGTMWADLLAAQINQPVLNLARVCASNLMIAQQVDQAQHADFVIVLFTASTRSQTQHNSKIIPWSWHSLDHTTPFDQRQLNILRNYAAEFFDLDLAIYESQCIIESVLQRLVDRGQKFCFDQGGFEHPAYGGQRKYFEKYNRYRSAVCAWDWAQTRAHRPYYHITDPVVHQRMADYYIGLINEHS